AQTVRARGESLRMVAPDHGPIWREPGHIDWLLNAYDRWGKRVPSKKVIVVYHTMWGSTEKMAHAIAEGLKRGGAEPKVMGLSSNHRSDVATEVLDAGGLVVGSSTLNNQYLPLVADCISYLKGLQPANLIGGVFGSYGWKSSATKNLAEELRQIGVEMPLDPVEVRYVPRESDLAECEHWGEQLAQHLQEALDSK
ncbi:MAG: FprA family A-type flavoprotein, partial [Lentisphaerae bacterium]